MHGLMTTEPNASSAVDAAVMTRRGEATHASSTELPEPDPRAAIARATILVIDDDRDVRDILSHYFTAKGFRVETTESAAGILDILERTRPDILLLDLMLPGEDGCLVVDRIRASPSWSRLPVVMITAAHEPRGLQALRAGTEGWFEKPLNLSVLLRHVERLLFPGEEVETG
jgi:DNA-binding response OmpR family regulator